jgi:UTP--glucose-1-phosphate uridylyltransferase
MTNRPIVTKVVLPVAGLGTRFLPATKATPKEMLPVVDKPAIQYVVEEAVAAGLSDVLFITGRNKTSLEDHFDRAPHLEQKLAERGTNDLSRVLADLADLASIHYVRQGAPLGLGHAVHVARGHVGQEPFVVMLGDDLIDATNPILPTMLDVQQRFGGSVLCLMEVPQEDIHLYGCAAVEPTDVPDVVRVTGLIEKPKAHEAPSNYAVIGRYVLQPEIFPILSTVQAGAGGEIQLTDALAALIDVPVENGGGIHAVVFRGKRYDTGDKLSYLKSVISLALDREEFSVPLRTWLEAHLAGDV